MPETLVPGSVLGGRYRLVRELARGGMGTVWVAEDPRLARTVAIKILDRALSSDENLRARFRREAVAAAAVTHPNIVATYDTGDDEGTAYIVMELIEGPTLRALLDDGGAMPVAKAVDIASQVADALDVAHARGLVHRDVKPGNVLVQPNGRVKVTDFGIAKAADSKEDLTRSGVVVGTARYLAPEQVDGRAVDERTDVYALGLVLYEMLVGRPPYQGDSDIATAVARLTSLPEPVRNLRADVPPELATVLNRALAREPDDRLPTAAAFRDALAPFRRDGTGETPVVDATVPVPVTRRTDPPTAIVAAVPTRAKPVGGRPWARILLWVAAFAVGLAGGYLGWRALDDAPAKEITPPPAPQVLPIANVRDYDPFGDDNEEDPEGAPLVVDGNTATFWQTSRYFQRDVGGKPGVGLVLDLGAPHQVNQVNVETPDTDWTTQIYVADQVPPTFAGWGQPRAQGAGLGAAAELTLQPPTRGQSVLLWITNLPTSRKLRVAEVQVVGLP